MAFSFKNFLLDLAALAPAIVGSVESLTQEASVASKTQLASDALHTLTGISTALLSSNSQDVQMAQIASSIVGHTINAFSPAPPPPPPPMPNVAPVTGSKGN